MGATENAGFGAKVQRNLGLDFVTKQHKSLEKPTSLRLSVSDMLTHVNFPTFAMADLRYGGPLLWRADMGICTIP